MIPDETDRAEPQQALSETLMEAERKLLLQFARQSILQVVGEEIALIDTKNLTPHLLAPGASFVTLTEEGELRGCIGTMEAYQPLWEDVREHAVAAATCDPRFPAVQVCEMPMIKIEISRLTPMQPLEYQTCAELMARLRPGVDGVLIRDGYQRATFLPQVWDNLSTPEEFLSHLCVKMGASANLWRKKHLKVDIYQVESFEE